jgi:hypothetical protein
MNSGNSIIEENTPKKNTRPPYLEPSKSIAIDFKLPFPLKLKGKSKEIPHWLEDDGIIHLVTAIFERCHVVMVGKSEKILLDNGNGSFQLLEKNLKNFVANIVLSFRTLKSEDGEYYFHSPLVNGAGYTCIDLEMLFEVIKTKNPKIFTQSSSIFYKNNSIKVTQDEVILETVYKYDFQIDGIEEDAYNFIVEDVSQHWQGNIKMILDHMVGSMYTVNKKALYMAILADSNFGKSKLFEWINNFNAIASVDQNDIVNTGNINNVSPDSIRGKLCLVFDESKYFNKKLYKVGAYVELRPMNSHSVKVPVHGKYFLTAEGGTFDNDFIDDQTDNRICMLDLRGRGSKELGQLASVEKYGETQIEIVMTHWLFTQILARINSYEAMDKFDALERGGKVVKEIFNAHRMDKKSLFTQIKENFLTIYVSGGVDTLDAHHQDMLVTSMGKTRDGDVLIFRATTVLKKLLLNFDSTMEHELKSRDIKEIAKNLGWGYGSYVNDEHEGKGSPRVLSVKIPASDIIAFKMKHKMIDAKLDSSEFSISA